MAKQKDEILQFLGHIGDDHCDDPKVAIWPECKADKEADEDTCPDHCNCGICRFEYMKAKGWLNPEVE